MSRSTPTRAAALAVALMCLGDLPAAADSLDDALSAAFQTNPKLEADRARHDAVRTEVPKAWTSALPTVTGSVGIERYEHRTWPSSLAYPDWNRVYELSVSQAIFRGFRTLNAVEGAKSKVAASSQELLNAEQDVLLSVAMAYLAVVRDRAIVTLRQRNVRIVADILTYTRAQKREGEATNTDVAQARSRLAFGRAQLESARAALARSQADFERAVGHAPGSLARPRQVGHLMPATLDEALALGDQQNPQVVAAVFRVEAADFEVAEAKGAFLPTVSLKAGYNYEEDTTYAFDRKDELRFGVRVSVPIYEAGTRFVELDRTRAVARQRVFELDDARRQVRASVSSAWSDHIAARLEIQSYSASVQSAEAAARGMRLESEAGERSITDVLDAERDVIDSQVALEEGLYRQQRSSYVLLAASGRLTAHALGLVEFHGQSVIYDQVEFPLVPASVLGGTWTSFTDSGVPETGCEDWAFVNNS